MNAQIYVFMVRIICIIELNFALLSIHRSVIIKSTTSYAVSQLYKESSELSSLIFQNLKLTETRETLDIILDFKMLDLLLL